MNNKFIFPLLSALCSAAMLLFSEILTVKYHYSPLFLIFLLNIFGGIFIFVLMNDKPNNPRKLFRLNPLLLVCASLFSYVFSGLAAFYTSSQLGSTKTAFVLQLETFFVVLFAILFLKERVTWKTGFAGALIIFGGIFLQFQEGAFSFTLTDGIALLSPLFFSIGIILNTYLLKHHDAVVVTAFGQLIAAVLVAFLFPWFNSSLTVLSLFFAILMAALEGLAWLFYNKGLAIGGASITTIVFGAIPFFTLFFSTVGNLFLKDFFIIPTNMFSVLTGGILIFTGILIIARSNP